MMEQKPKFIKILVALWIIIAILFVCKSVYVVGHYLDSADMDFGGLNNQIFVTSFVIPIAFIIFYSLFSVLLAYGTFVKKSWTWLVGLMLAAYILLSSISSAVSMYGMALTSWIDNYYFFDVFSQNLPYAYAYFISNPCLAALAALVIYLSMKTSTKEYFGKKLK